MKHNYQKELEKILEERTTVGKRLFLHSCCAPCSSYVLLYLRRFFRITVFYYNPNITEQEEYRKRASEQKRLIEVLNQELRAEETEGFPIEIQEGDYRPQVFFQTVRGLEQCPEGGERCRRCFALRLEETAKRAQAQAFDFFTTTLTISPLKDAEALNEIGQEMGVRYGIPFLPSDFKKRDGYKSSILLSGTYNLYRQDYCGCVFSRAQRQEEIRRRQSMDTEQSVGRVKEKRI